MNAWRIGTAAMVGLWATASADAQVNRPIVTTSDFVRPEISRLNLEDLEEPNDGLFELSWSAAFSNLQSYQYEITYDLSATMTNPNPRLIELDNTVDAGEREGTAIAGQTYRLRMRPSQVLFDESAPDQIIRGNDQIRNIVVNVFPSDRPADEMVNGTATWQFQYDTIAPDPPTILEVLPGERRLIAQFTPPPEDNNEFNQFFEAVYCVATSSAGFPGYRPDPAPEEGHDLGVLPCEQPLTARVGRTLTQVEFSGGLSNGVPVAVALRTIDGFDNVGGLSDVVTSTPTPIFDFFEWYQLNADSDELEQGGFCFVATAAYGSQHHPWVVGLRAFRDQVLGRSPSGVGLTRMYYGLSPGWAEWIRHSPARRMLSQAVLAPAVAWAAGRLVAPWLGGVLFLILLGRRLRRSSRGRKALGGGAAVCLAALGTSSTAWAEVELGHSSRSEARMIGQRPRSALPVGLGFEFKIGPYLPRMGSSEATNPAWDNIFGAGSMNPLFNVGAEVLFFRKFGSLGAYGSAGFAKWTGRGLLPESTPGTPVESEDDTTLNVVPLTLQLTYRLDFIADATPVPLIPYFRGGLAYTFFWVTDGNGSVARFERGPDEADDLFGRGGKFGLTGTAGVALLLNFIDNSAVQKLYNSTKIRGTYLFWELVAGEVDNFGEPGFDFSDFTWNAGLRLEW